MIRINQITVSIYEPFQEAELRKRAASVLYVPEDGFRKLKIVRRAVDARDRNDIRYSYTVDAKLRDTFTGPNAATERQYIERLKNRNISQAENIPVIIPDVSEAGRAVRPLIVGSGPSGLFAALTLTASGLKPVIAERGDDVSARKKKCDRFFEYGKLCADSNIQFGEGGAGLFSDGKLNTSVKGRENYVRFILETFNEFGAPDDILTDAKPHVGTDILFNVVRGIRDHITENGGEYLFNTKFTGFETKNGRIARALFDGKDPIDTDFIVLCHGHSARDTYRRLCSLGVPMQKKPFAMGIRIQHPQELIDGALYGEERLCEKQRILGPASYGLTHRCENGRGVFSFCMCPGGYVVNSSSEEGRLTVNGMSYHARESGMANSAIIVSLGPDDFPGDDALSGIEFQKELEERAYGLCGGLIPFETYGEFKRGETSPTGEGRFDPCFLGMSAPADLRSALPEFMQEALIEGIDAFGKKVKGFDDPDAVIAGIEARTSSPVRILRDESCGTCIPGLYAAGEGAGYAGGIVTAAADGIRAALGVIEKINSEVKNG